jgi:RHS repeat-associated protein
MDGQNPGPATRLLKVVEDVQTALDTPNYLLAAATKGISDFLPCMPAARLYSDLVFQFGHIHLHPPTFGFPLPSVGPILASGAVNVLINGLPAARNGDYGLSVWCGGYFPIFEIMFGSSHVFIGGSRAARMLMDFTLHCLPDFFSKGKKMKVMNKRLARTAAKMAANAALKQAAQSALIAGGMKGLQLAAKAEQAEVSENEVDSENQAAADAAQASAEAQAAGVEALMTGLQIAADAAAAAMGLFMGRDAGIGFPMGFIMMGSPNVVIGGFPMVGTSTILKGLGKVLKAKLRKLQMKLPPGKLRRSMCFLTGCPVEVVTGRMITPSLIDFEVEGRIPIVFERVYDTSSVDYEGLFGWGWTHPYNQHLWESKKYNCLVLRNHENRQVRFDKLEIGQKQFQPLERVWLERKSEAEFELTECETNLIYKFAQIGDEDFKSEITALRLTEILDLNGNHVQLNYSSNGLLTEISNDSESSVTLDYSDIGGRKRLTEVRQSLKNGQNISLMKYGYNGDGELISDTNRTYASSTYSYENRLITRRTNRDGFAFNYEYEGNGSEAKCVHTWGDDGIFERWLTYLPQSKMSTVKYGIGGETIYHYDELDMVTKIFDAENGLTQFEYGINGELLKETDELLNTRTYSYDNQLNCIGIVQEDGTTRQVVFDEQSQPLVVTDELGNEWKRKYDEKGNIIATVNPLGACREYEYNHFGDISIFRDALGNETKLDWSTSGQIKSVIRPRGGKTSYSYNERDYLSEVSDEFTGLKVDYQYDDAGRVKKVTETNARRETLGVQRYEYDVRDRLTLYVDALGNRTTYKYTGYDTLSEQVDAIGYKRQFKYDRENRLTEITNELGENYKFEYDLLDRVLEETGFDGAKRVYKYDNVGNLIYQKDALNRESHFQRDKVGRITSRIRSDNTLVNYTYDECGRITIADNEQTVVNLTYDAAWQVIKEEQNGQIVSYEYDAEGRRIARNLKGETSDGSSVKYNYDEDNNLLLVNIGEKEITYERDINGRLTNRQMANGLNERFDYDINGRLSGQKITVGGGGREIVKRGYEWDALGNVVGISDSLHGSKRYSYNAVERLSKVERIISGEKVALPEQPREASRTKSVIPENKRLWVSDDRSGRDFGQIREVEEFQYDGDGNLLERKSNVRGSRRFKYGKGDKLTNQEKVQYIYDAVGNLIQKRQADGSSISYQYDADNQLVLVSTETNGKIEFRYDAFGRRTTKISDKGTTGFIWDGDVLLSENKDSQLVTEYVHEGFVPLAKIKDSRIETYHTDYLGTPKEVSNDAGEIVWQGNYDEYGRVEATINQSEQNIRFQGQYEDDETGLFYNRFRYYDAESSRYINKDPIETEGGLNIYQYGKNPVNWVDPFGLETGKDAKILAGNMEVGADGVRPSSDYRAHHIVMSNSTDSRMEAVRDKMQKLGIDINDSRNGIWLPETASGRLTGDKMIAHKGQGVHGHNYKQHIHDSLMGATSKRQFLARLRAIKKDLGERHNKPFPKKGDPC